MKIRRFALPIGLAIRYPDSVVEVATEIMGFRPNQLADLLRDTSHASYCYQEGEVSLYVSRIPGMNLYWVPTDWGRERLERMAFDLELPGLLWYAGVELIGEAYLPLEVSAQRILRISQQVFAGSDIGTYQLTSAICDGQQAFGGEPVYSPKVIATRGEYELVMADIGTHVDGKRYPGRYRATRCRDGSLRIQPKAEGGHPFVYLRMEIRYRGLFPIVGDDMDKFEAGLKEREGDRKHC